MAPSLSKAVHDRNSIKDTLDILQTELTNHATVPLTEPEVQHLLATVKTAQTDIIEIHKQIQLCSPPDMGPHQLEYQQLFARSLKLLSAYTGLKMTFPVTSSTSSSSSTASAGGAAREIKLPRLELPFFDGNLHEWVSFRDIFVTAVHDNKDYGKSQKLTYLKSKLRGEAARQIQSIIISDANYDIAWAQLVSRYQNDRELMFAVLRRFTDMPHVQNNNPVAVRQLVDTSRECIRSLDVLKLPTDQWDAILMFHIHQKMDSASRELWEQGLKDSAIPKLDSLFDFLEQRGRSLAAGIIPKPSFKPQQFRNDGEKNRNPANRNMAHHVQTPANCKSCPTLPYHPLFRCSTFHALSIDARIEVVKRQSLCFNCLNEGHSASHCPSTKGCRKCGSKHNSLIHRDKPAAPAPNVPRENCPTAMHTTQPQQLTVTKPENPVFETILATAIVLVPDHSGTHQLVRAFLDNGSNRNFITESCINRLGLSRSSSSASISGLGEECVVTTRGTASLTFSPHFKRSVIIPIQTLIVKKITGKLPQLPLHHKNWWHLKSCQLADPSFFKPAPVDLLLGAEIFFSVIQSGKMTGPSGSPFAIQSTLGWLVGGGGGNHTSGVSNSYHTNEQLELNNRDLGTSKNSTANDQNLDSLLQRFWEIESVPVTKALTQEEEACENHFTSTYSRNLNGRFTVRLPLKSPRPALGSSLDIATRQFKYLERS